MSPRYSPEGEPGDAERQAVIDEAAADQAAVDAEYAAEAQAARENEPIWRDVDGNPVTLTPESFRVAPWNEPAHVVPPARLWPEAEAD